MPSCASSANTQLGEWLQRVDPVVGAFRRAVYGGDPEDVRALVEKHPSATDYLDAPLFPFGAPALVHAAGQRSREMVDMLLDLGADIDVRSEWEAGPYTALHRLVDGPSVESLALAEHLVERGATVDIHAASGLGDLDRIEEILADDPTVVSQPGPDGATPLHLARAPEVAELLLRHGAELEKRCVDHQSTPAMWAVDGREDVMLYLLQAGAKPDIFQAVLLDDVSLVRAILEVEPDAIDVRLNVGETHPHLGGGDKYVWALGGAETPLELARQRGMANCYSYLLARSRPEVQLLQASRRGDERDMLELIGAYAQLLERAPSTVLAAALYGSPVGARVLMQHHVNPNIRDEWGATPLHHASYRGLIDVARVLLDYGADPSLRDGRYDSTPLGWAHESGQRLIMDLILARHPPDIVEAAWLGDSARVAEILDEDPTLVNGLENGRISPLRSAASCGHLAIVKLLLERGAEAALPHPDSGLTALDYAHERGYEDVAQALSA